MSVFTTLLLISFLLYTSHGAPNKNSREDGVRRRDLLGPRQNHYLITNLYSGSVALPSAWSSFTNPFSTGTGTSTAPTGTANAGDGSATSGGLQPYPTQGAPYQNYTSPYNPLGSVGLVAAPTSQPPAALSIENAAAAAGSSILSNQCQPPQTVTLPAETITVTAAPQTITITPEVQTQTITITPQVQTQTVTVTVTITAGPAPACPSNAGSPEVPPVAAPSNAIPVAPSNAPTAGSVPNSEGQNQLPAQASGPAPGPTPAMPASQTPASALPTNIAAPSAAPAMPSMPAAPTILPAIPSNEGPESVPAAASSTTTLSSAPTFNAPILPLNSNPLGVNSGAPPVLPLTAPYQNTTGPYNMTVPCGSGMSGTMPGTGFPRPTGGIMPPIGLPLPSGYSLQFSFPTNAASGAILSGLAGPTAQITLPTALGNQTAQSDIGPNSPFIPAPALPTVPPMPPVNQSDVQGPPLSPFSTTTECSLNGTTAQNITTNYSNLLPSLPTTPLIYLGLNYTSFTLSPLQPLHLTSPPSSSPKAISIAPPFLSYSLTSLSLSCGPAIPPTENCSVEIAAYGLPAAATTTTAGDDDEAAAIANTAYIRAVELQGPGMQLVEGFEEWVGLWQVNFTARWGEVEMGVGVGEVRYQIVGVCEGGVGGSA